MRASAAARAPRVGRALPPHAKSTEISARRAQTRSRSTPRIYRKRRALRRRDRGNRVHPQVEAHHLLQPLAVENGAARHELQLRPICREILIANLPSSMAASA